MAEVLFFIAGIGAIAGAIGVVRVSNPFYSVLSLVFHLLSLAALFLLLRAQFVAAAQVVVYAGAVMVLYVFVVAYVGGDQMPMRPAGGNGATICAHSRAGVLTTPCPFGPARRIPSSSASATRSASARRPSSPASP